MITEFRRRRSRLTALVFTAIVVWLFIVGLVIGAAWSIGRLAGRW